MFTFWSWCRWLITLTLLVCLSGCPFSKSSSTITKPESVHLLLGNPSGATTNIANQDNYLILRPQYSLSYNRSKGTPNWSSWQLNQSWLGNAPRQNNFRPDQSLPPGWDQVRPSDYIHTGYDKGHLTPSADRSRTIEDNSATFLMTNMIPQSPDNNQGPWADLEDYCRSLAHAGKELYIIAGIAGKQGTIAQGKVTVPQVTWKIIVVFDHPGSGSQDVTKNTPVIAIEMPNSSGIRTKNWQSFQTTVHQIEVHTGYNFLSNISPSIQKEIEIKILSPFSPLKKYSAHSAHHHHHHRH